MRPGIQTIFVKAGTEMNMKMRHRLLSCAAACMKQVDTRAANRRAVVQSHFLEGDKNTTEGFRRQGKQVGTVRFERYYSVTEGLDFKRKKTNDFLVFVNHPRWNCFVDELADNTIVHARFNFRAYTINQALPRLPFWRRFFRLGRCRRLKRRLRLFNRHNRLDLFGDVLCKPFNSR